MHSIEYRPVVGLEGRYVVSETGLIRNCKTGREFKGSPTKSGHLLTSFTVDGKRIQRYVHHLVAEAFISLRPTGLEIRHLNGDPSDNRVENLQYGTRRENRLDDVRNGRHYQASKALCKRGHPLTHPNLDIGRLPNRICLSCKRAKMLATHHSYGEEWVQEDADRRFRELTI